MLMLKLYLRLEMFLATPFRFNLRVPSLACSAFFAEEKGWDEVYNNYKKTFVFLKISRIKNDDSKINENRF